MKKIRMLDPQITNQIAAGEVIERPASVVKELVENSLDAAASKITVEIKNGGMKYIRVEDDGHGIDPADVELATKRHTTSKIMTFEDLNNIRTLGFRGEALASIDAVSKLEIYTRTRERESGIYMKNEGGKNLLSEEKGGPPGTSVIVKDLFFNVPARKKHLKSVASETAAISSLLCSIILGNPKNKFTYINNRKIEFVSPGNGKQIDAISVLFGSTFAKNLLELSYQENYYAITGFVGKPELNRGNRQGQYFIVNGRVIYSKIIADALEEAYRTLLPKNRYPVAFINIEVLPSLIDVNVHPAKKEIRWLEPTKVAEILTEAVKKALTVKASIPGLSKEMNKRKTNYHIEYEQESFPLKTRNIIPLAVEEKQTLTHSLQKKSFDEAANEKPFPSLQPIEQIDATYILAKSEYEKGFFIVDQHAAHERIIYDLLMKKIDSSEVLCQHLTTPVALELSPVESSNLIRYIYYLRKMGFSIENFGNNTFLIRSVPHGLKKLNPQELIYDLISEEVDDYKKRKDIFHIILQQVACKGAVKAGERMQKEAMIQLLNELENTAVPYTCPHGRPTTVHISPEELVKKFYR